MIDLPHLAAKRYALRCLTLRGHFADELIAKMKVKKFPPDHIAIVVQEMTELGYINDQELLESAVRGYMSKKIGLRSIAYKLAQKGVPQDLIEEELQKYNADDEIESIQSLLATRYRQRDLTNKKERDKVIASLSRKGFSLPTILQVIKSL